MGYERMSDQALGQQDVYRAVLERIRNGEYPPGAKLDSCRALAGEIGSNPNTVHRALKVLESEGLVRTVPRKGTFVTGMAAPEPSDEWLRDELAQLITRSAASGIDGAVLRRLLDEELRRMASSATVLFPECNLHDAEEMATSVEQASGMELTPVLIDELPHVVRAVDDPVIAVPLFHLGDVRRLEIPAVPVVELTFVPDPHSLIELASLDPGAVVTVASRYERGVDRLASIVRQYFGGEVDARLLDTSEADFSGVDVLVYNNASGLTDTELASAPTSIRLSVILDGSSASTLRARVDQARGAQQGTPATV